MAEKLFMTALSPTMERGKITEWHKKEGEAVNSGDVICEVETDKAVMEYEADFDAVLLKIIVNDGESAEVGDIIGVYGEAGEDYSELVQTDLTPVEVETTKNSGQQAVGPIEQEGPEKILSTQPRPPKRLKASPLARKMASDLNVDLLTVKGSGHDGRIIKRDILNAAETGAPVTFAAPEVAGGTTSRSQSFLTDISPMRSTIAKRLSGSKFTAPHFYLTLKADMSVLLSARNEYAKRTGAKPSLNAYLVKLAAAVLRKFPAINSSWENDKIRKFSSVDIGFAVALDDGLIAPVIKNCELKGIMDIDSEFRLLAEKAKKGTIKPAEYTGAGFSISNLGSFGIEEFTAIINPPGSAILAVGAIMKTPVVETDQAGNDSVVIKPMMNMTLSCDHRVVDGAVGAAFLAELKRAIENPVEAMM